MKKKIALLTFILSLFCVFTAFGATFSSAWKQGSDGVWRVYDSQGILQRNAWFCDDAAGGAGAKDNWYLLDGNGTMVSAPIVRDGTGNFYSLETSHNGYFGMIRHKTGTYDGVYMIFSQNHDGTFGAIQNPDAINTLIARYGLMDVANINNSNCIYSSKIISGKTPQPEPDSTEYRVRYYVDGSLWKTTTNSSSHIKIKEYSDRLLYWEDRGTGEIYYPGEYTNYGGNRRTINLDAVLEEERVYTLTYYSDDSYYDQQTSGSGHFKIIKNPKTTRLGVEFVGWKDSHGSMWYKGETYTAYTRSDKLTAVWKTIGRH